MSKKLRLSVFTAGLMVSEVLLAMGTGWSSKEVSSCDFTCGETLCRMTWTGPETGWRLRSAKADGTFSDQGAVQKLASFMGEKAPSADRAFVLEQKDGRKVCQASDGTRIAIETNGSFRVFSVSGKMVTEVLAVVSDGKSVRLSGRLLDAEAVYGGGERLDRLNQRGRKMDLWICDGYNDSSATYLVIPFFVTTRGGGVFVNQYERLTADFGADEPNVWSVTAPRTDLNAYFYAKDTIAEAVAAQVALSGRPYAPPEWSRGPIICRYTP